MPLSDIQMPSSDRVRDMCRSPEARVVRTDNRRVTPFSSVTRSYEALKAGWSVHSAATMRPDALMRRPESCTRTDSIRDRSTARHVSSAGQVDAEPVASGAGVLTVYTVCDEAHTVGSGAVIRPPLSPHRAHLLTRCRAA